MKKPIKSEARKLFFTMISKYQQKKEDRKALFKEKDQCLRAISEAIDAPEINILRLREAVNQLHDLENKDLLLKESQYIEEIASMTDVIIATINRIKKEGKTNDNIWNTTGKKRPHKSTVSNLDSFDIASIRNKINEFYWVRKQVPTLRSLLVDLKESIGFTGCKETLRKILENGYEFKKNKNE